MEKSQFIADLGVYNKNRMMRIFDSTKFGKGRETSLKILNQSSKSSDLNEKTFLNTLICNATINMRTKFLIIQSLTCFRLLTFDAVSPSVFTRANLKHDDHFLNYNDYEFEFAKLKEY